jgi:hypothetical protein
MAYLLTNFWPGGTEAQYRATVEAVHPAGGLPEGQTYHAAGPSEGGYLVAAVWESKEACDRFIADVLTPAAGGIEGGLVGPPEARMCEISNLVATTKP